MFNSKIILITGGTDSFGNTVVRRFLKTDIKRNVYFGIETQHFRSTEVFENQPEHVLYKPKGYNRRTDDEGNTQRNRRTQKRASEHPYWGYR